MSPLLTLLVVLLVVLVALYLWNHYIPDTPSSYMPLLKLVVNIVVVVLALLYVLHDLIVLLGNGPKGPLHASISAAVASHLLASARIASLCPWSLPSTTRTSAPSTQIARSPMLQASRSTKSRARAWLAKVKR
jgi:hypothetical protein